MLSKKPLGNRNENDASIQEGVSPEKKKHESPIKRCLNFDTDVSSPETICRPKLSGCRRSSPFNCPDNNALPPSPFSPFGLEESAKINNDVKLPSAAVADLWNKPLKLNSSQIENSPKGTELCSQNVISQFPFSKTKLSFELFSEGSPSPPVTSATNQRRSLGYRRSLSCASQETPSKKNIFPLLNSEDSSTPFFKPKRHKFGIDENSSSSSPSDNDPGRTSLTPEVKRLTFFRSQSESALTPTSNIKNALERIEGNPNLIGDGSKSYVLPFTNNGKHQDLKEITGLTLAQLLSSQTPNIPKQLQGHCEDQSQSHQQSDALVSSSGGDADVTVSSFKVIDCRYPYEYDSGHIKGAINLFTKNQIYQELIEPKILTTKEKNENISAKEGKERHILIFHCEFSSQRGPEMCRYLRDTDRESNMSHYPKLFYPEMYVLFGGYKLFFEQFPTLCDPQAYLPMDHPSHIEDCRRFKLQTKLERPTKDLLKKSKSQSKFQRNTSFARKCNL